MSIESLFALGDARAASRHDCGCRAIGILQGLIDMGLIDAFPHTKQTALDICAEFDAACKPFPKEAA